MRARVFAKVDTKEKMHLNSIGHGFTKSYLALALWQNFSVQTLPPLPPS